MEEICPFSYDLSRRGSQPRYLFLYSQIRDDIIQGTIKENVKLPSKRKLAQSLGVSVVTVEKAYEQLEAEGYIHARQRSGYFVSNIGASFFTFKQAIGSDSGPENKILEDASEEDALTDLQANRSISREFPVTTWLKVLRQSISENRSDLFKTIPYHGLPALRQALAHYLFRSRGMQVHPDQIIIGAGTEYLYSRLIQLLHPHSKFVFENPGYQKLARIADNYHAAWTYCNVDRQGLIVSRLRATGGSIVHTSPANSFPAGFTMSLARRTELMQWVYEKPNRYIVEDDYDSELRFEGRPLPPLFAYDSKERVIYLNTFSKTLMPSLRISYMILPPHLLQRYRETMSFYSCTVSGLEQHALAHFIDEGYFERHLARLRIHYRKQRKAVMQAIQSSDLAEKSRIIENNAGTHFLLYLNTSLTKREIKQAVAKHGINLALLDDYCFRYYPEARRVLVVNYASLSADEVKDTVNKLAQALADAE